MFYSKADLWALVNRNQQPDSSKPTTDLSPQTPSLSPPRSSRWSDYNHHALARSPNHSHGESSKILETDMEANNSLAETIRRNRPQMSIEERTLRMELFWLDSRIADQQATYQAYVDDHADKKRRLQREVRWRQRKLDNMNRLDELLKRKEQADSETGSEELEDLEETEFYRGFAEKAVLHSDSD